MRSSDEMEVQVKPEVYARKLKTRLVELKRERVAALAKYKDDLAKWRKVAASYVAQNATAQIQKMTERLIEDHFHSRGYHREQPTIGITGVPVPPKKPDDAAIRLAQRTLRLIAMTSPKTLRVNRAEMEQLFNDEGAADE